MLKSKKITHDSQIVRAIINLKLSLDGTIQRQTSGIFQSMNALMNLRPDPSFVQFKGTLDSSAWVLIEGIYVYAYFVCPYYQLLFVKIQS